MNSNLFLEFETFESRWGEVRRIIESAQSIKDVDTALYNTQCRAGAVFLSAHFEGTLKDVISAILKDLNQNVKFSDLSEPIKRTYAKYFYETSDEQFDDNRNINKLLSKFCASNITLDSEAFLKANKNPKGSIIKAISSKFGIEDFFGYFCDSNLEIVFENNLAETIEFHVELKKELKKDIELFPYINNIDKYNMKKRSKSIKGNKTLYEEFLDDFLQIRHGIVHGNNISNSLNDKKLLEFMYKVEILLMGFIILIISSLEK